MKKIRCFVMLPVPNREEAIFDSDLLLDIAEDLNSLQEFLHKYSEMVEIAECERGARVIYDSENIEEFQQEMNAWNDEFISLQHGLYALLSNAEDIRGKLGQEPYGYFLWNFNAGIQISGSISILAQIAEEVLQDEAVKAEKGKKLAELTKKSLDEDMKMERQGKLARIAEDILQDENRHVLVHNSSICPNRPSIPIIRDKDSHKDECPRLVCIQYMKNSDELKSWIRQNRQPRKFHLHKHGEYGKGAEANKGEKVSVLSCGRAHAQELLNTAVGDQRITKRLLNFDKECEKYIVFEKSEGKEGLKNTYHGYHVENENEIHPKDRCLLKLLKIRMANKNADDLDSPDA